MAVNFAKLPELLGRTPSPALCSALDRADS